MRTNNIQITAYFSHAIRGAKGDAATVEDMSLNNDLAALVGKMVMEACPALDLYIPAVHDEYVVEAYTRGCTLEHEILEIDKIILKRRQIMIMFCYNGVISNGMNIEKDEAFRNAIPIFAFEKVTEIPRLVEQIIDWFYDGNV